MLRVNLFLSEVREIHRQLPIPTSRLEKQILTKWLINLSEENNYQIDTSGLKEKRKNTREHYHRTVFIYLTVYHDNDPSYGLLHYYGLFHNCFD